METPTVPRLRLAQAFETGQPLQSVSAETPLSAIYNPAKQAITYELTPRVDHELLLVHASMVLGFSLSQVTLVQIEGRFAVVNYTPVQRPDPDVLLCFDDHSAADAFHKIVLGFQQIRRWTHVDQRRWHAQAKAYLEKFVGPLHALGPSPAEANFVLRWAWGVVAMGQTVNDFPIDGTPEWQKVKDDGWYWVP